MKKFRFPLQSVATLRNMRENQQRERFAAAVHRFVDAEQALAEVRKRIDQLENLIAAERSGNFRPAAQIAFMQALEAEQRHRLLAAGQVAEAKAAMERERMAWLEARRDVRLIKILEDKARAVHRHELDREEQALLDDRANSLASRTAV